jgi:hypothetical protein
MKIFAQTLKSKVRLNHVRVSARRPRAITTGLLQMNNVPVSLAMRSTQAGTLRTNSRGVTLTPISMLN